MNQEITQNYQAHISALVKAGVPMTDYTANCCGETLQTRSNPTTEDWDTVAHCPHCGETYIKITLAEQKGVLYHPIESGYAPEFF